MNFIKRTLFLCCPLVFATVVSAQTSPAQQPAIPAAPVSYSSISELNQILGNLNQASQNAHNDLSRLRIERWKTDSNTKKQTESDTESILRNLKDALPTIVMQLQGSPENLAVTFKLYRNLDALYDVFSSVVESAGAFGSKEEFQSLNDDLNALDHSRHALGERMDKLATAKDNEIGELRVALQNARAEIPPKKVIVDDTEPPKKTTSHKKSTAKKPTAKPKIPPKSQTTTNPSPQ